MCTAECTLAIKASHCMTPHMDWVAVCSEIPPTVSRAALLSIKRGGSLHPSFWSVREEEGWEVDEMASANTLGPCLGLNINDWKRSPWYVFPGAASPSLWLSLEEYRSPECALMSVEFLEWTSAVATLCLETQCGGVLLWYAGPQRRWWNVSGAG